ncbi:unannotated protein [freshwater metagenome]|uniref:Unannotated protein n=1 Tax=freshwater metagenome TaxID=449393 RepID=A0A6J7NZY6_9ZZZZ
MLTDVAVTRAEIAIVEYEGRHAGFDEHLRVVGLAQLLDVAPAARHRDRSHRAGGVFGQVEIATYGDPFTRERDLFDLHGVPLMMIPSPASP